MLHPHASQIHQLTGNWFPLTLGSTPGQVVPAEGVLLADVHRGRVC